MARTTPSPPQPARPADDDGAARRDALTRRGLRSTWWAEVRPDAPAVVAAPGTEGGDRTFAELDAGANRVVRALRERGLGVGDAVAVACRNRAELVEVVLATQRAGLRLTMVNWHLTGDEAAYIVADCGARAFVADAAVGRMAAAAAAGAPGCDVLLSVGGAIDGFAPLAEAVAGVGGEPLDDPTPGSTMLYTSGTTGRPKGVHRPFDPDADAAPVANLYGYDPDGGDVHLCTGPLYHAAPLAFSLLVPLHFGATVVVMDRWDAATALRLVEEHSVTHTHMVATMFHRLLSLPPEVREPVDVSSLRHVLHGAAPCPVPVKQALIDWVGPIVWEYYAATEGVGCFASPATWLERPGTVGRPVPEDQVFVGSPDGDPLPPGEVGLVYIKAPATGRFTYFGDDAKTESSYRGDHFTLGDVGYVDADGYLFLTDRSADLIISGGVNIYPAEVDAVLLTHPAVGDAATIGVPDDEWGETVLSVVELQPDVSPSAGLATELVEHCRARLAHFKCPREVEFTDRLPRQDNGKLYKRRLREQYAARPTQEG